jgi:hypothetical protein
MWIRLNPVDRINVAYQASEPRSEVQRYQALASEAINGWSDRLFRASNSESWDRTSVAMSRVPGNGQTYPISVYFRLFASSNPGPEPNL